MIPTLDLLDIAAAAYGPADVESATAHAIIRQIDMLTVVAFRGTKNFVDVISDIQALPVKDLVLGFVHDGFFKATASVAWQLIPRLAGKKTIVIGHSLGGADALIFGAMLAAIGEPPVWIETFGSAAPGGLPLAASLPGIDWRNASDPVPEEPRLLARPRALRQIGVPSFDLDPIRWHFLAAYRTALQGLGPLPRVDAASAAANPAGAPPPASAG